ncbi:MAG: glycosyltransferase family 2 protein [Planctomycetota bacterium]
MTTTGDPDHGTAAGSAPVTSPPLEEARRLVVILPALNEECSIAGVIGRIPRRIPGVDLCQVVVIDDGSTDRTGEIARGLGAAVVRHPRPSGVGAAFQSGLNAAIELGADLIVSIDADGQLPPEEIPRLLGPLLRGEADFVTATRFQDPQRLPRMPRIKVWGNRQVSRLISTLTGSDFSDVSCGMRAYSRRAALSLSLVGTFTYTHEVFLNLASKRMNIAEVRIDVRGTREFGDSRVAQNLIRYGFHTARIIFACYRDYHSLRLFGSVALLLSVAGGLLLGFLTMHFLSSGSFSPHKWAGLTGGALLAAALGSLVLGILGDMINRQRIYLEELLYHARAQWSPRRDPREGVAPAHPSLRALSLPRLGLGRGIRSDLERRTAEVVAGGPDEAEMGKGGSGDVLVGSGEGA